MTEEEKLAEEYVREIKAIANDSKVRIDRIVDKTKDAFIAGYMKGLPKWHKIADGDLPEEDSTCLVRCDNGNGYKYTSILKYDENLPKPLDANDFCFRYSGNNIAEPEHSLQG